MKVDIIIPTYNGLQNIVSVLGSINIQTFNNNRIIIVDNCSDDGTVDYIKENRPDVILIENQSNLGFSKAVNAGIKFSLSSKKSDVILLLNNDIELEPDFIEKGIITFGEVKEVDFIAVKMMNYFNRNIIDDTGDFIRKSGGTPMARGHGEIDNGQYNRSEFIFGACAGAAFYKSVLFEAAGLFDEDFFAYLEDVDLSFRFQLHGFKCYYNPEIICYHKRRETSNRFEGLETYYTERNILILRLKNYPLGLYLKYSLVFFLARINRYRLFLFNYPKGTFKFAIKGYFGGLAQLLRTLKKRKIVQAGNIVSSEYLEKLF
jgi:hypothetical protein